jgi:hypothetical protein
MTRRLHVSGDKATSVEAFDPEASAGCGSRSGGGRVSHGSAVVGSRNQARALGRSFPDRHQQLAYGTAADVKPGGLKAATNEIAASRH